MKFWWESVPHKEIPTFFDAHFWGLLSHSAYAWREIMDQFEDEDWRAAREQLYAVKKGWADIE